MQQTLFARLCGEPCRCTGGAEGLRSEGWGFCITLSKGPDYLVIRKGLSDPPWRAQRSACPWLRVPLRPDLGYPGMVPQ